MTSDETTTVDTSRTADTRTTATSHQHSFDLTLNCKGSSKHSDDASEPNEMLQCL